MGYTLCSGETRKETKHILNIYVYICSILKLLADEEENKAKKMVSGIMLVMEVVVVVVEELKFRQGSLSSKTDI